MHRLGYRFVAPVTAGAAPPPPWAPARPAPPPLAPPPLVVGRAAELAQLHACFAQARQGVRQTVFVTGEAGMGKTTLVDAFVRRWRPPTGCGSGAGSASNTTGRAKRICRCSTPWGGWAGGRAARGWWRVCASMPRPGWRSCRPCWGRGAGGVQHPVQRTTRERMLRELAEALEACTAEQPLVLVLEDLHWSDASTVEALALLARRREAARLLVLGTYRPVELILQAASPQGGQAGTGAHGQAVEVPLGYLPGRRWRPIWRSAGPAGGARRRGGVWCIGAPRGIRLFMVQVVDVAGAAAARSGRARRADAPGEGLDLAVPPGLQQLIELQLGQLGAEEQQVLEVASVAGAEFAVASVAAGLHRARRHGGGV